MTLQGETTNQHPPRTQVQKSFKIFSKLNTIEYSKRALHMIISVYPRHSR